MKRRDFIPLLGGACMLLADVMLGNVGVARSEGVVERLSVPESIAFNGETYRLSWSSHPKPHYYKQEYLPSGQTSERFQRMILIEATVRDVDVKDVVAAQVNMLNKRKSTDPTVNFAILKNSKNEEIILDFILSAQKLQGRRHRRMECLSLRGAEGQRRRVWCAVVRNKQAWLRR